MKPFELSEIRQAVNNGLKLRAAAAEKTSTNELTKLSDLNQMLFATNDRASLVTSSLKFIMMHLHVSPGLGHVLRQRTRRLRHHLDRR